MNSSSDDDDVALAGRDGEGNDLVLELAGLLRGLGLVLRGGGEAVLLFAGDLPLGGDVLRRRCPCDSRGRRRSGRPCSMVSTHLQFAHLHAGAQMRGVRGHATSISWPPATMMSASPLAICCRPSATARRPAAAQLVERRRRSFPAERRPSSPPGAPDSGPGRRRGSGRGSLRRLRPARPWRGEGRLDDGRAQFVRRGWWRKRR